MSHGEDGSDGLSHRCWAEHMYCAVSICAVSDAALRAGSTEVSMMVGSLQVSVCNCAAQHCIRRGRRMQPWLGTWVWQPTGHVCRPYMHFGCLQTCGQATITLQCCSIAAASDLGLAQDSMSAAGLPTIIRMLLPITLASPTALKPALRMQHFISPTQHSLGADGLPCNAWSAAATVRQGGSASYITNPPEVLQTVRCSHAAPMR